MDASTTVANEEMLLRNTYINALFISDAETDNKKEKKKSNVKWADGNKEVKIATEIIDLSPKQIESHKAISADNLKPIIIIKTEENIPIQERIISFPKQKAEVLENKEIDVNLFAVPINSNIPKKSIVYYNHKAMNQVKMANKTKNQKHLSDRRKIYSEGYYCDNMISNNLVHNHQKPACNT